MFFVLNFIIYIYKLLMMKFKLFYMLFVLVGGVFLFFGNSLGVGVVQGQDCIGLLLSSVICGVCYGGNNFLFIIELEILKDGEVVVVYIFGEVYIMWVLVGFIGNFLVFGFQVVVFIGVNNVQVGDFQNVFFGV